MTELSKNTELQQSCITDVSKSVLISDKCELDFLKWYEEKYISVEKFLKDYEPKQLFESLHYSFKLTLIIEFLDSTEIFIDCGYYAKNLLCSGIESPKLKIGFISLGTTFINRNEAILSAILKANSLYNENVV